MVGHVPSAVVRASPLIPSPALRARVVTTPQTRGETGCLGEQATPSRVTPWEEMELGSGPRQPESTLIWLCPRVVAVSSPFRQGNRWLYLPPFTSLTSLTFPNSLAKALPTVEWESGQKQLGGEHVKLWFRHSSIYPSICPSIQPASPQTAQHQELVREHVFKGDSGGKPEVPGPLHSSLWGGTQGNSLKNTTHLINLL